MTIDVREEATATVTDELAPRYCWHKKRCVCRPRLRGTSWLIIDALISAGWTLTPPDEVGILSCGCVPPCEGGHEDDPW